MVAHYAILKNGAIVNVCEPPMLQSMLDSGEAVELKDGFWIGDLYDGKTFSKAPDLRPLDEVKAAAIERIAASRYDAEFGGTVWNGFPIQTDRDSRAILTGEYVAADSGVRKDGEIYKFPDGAFRALSNADLKAMTLAVREHVKNCYGKEGQLMAQIAAATTNAEADAVSWG